ncbi:30S ribosomal protein S17e [archaeon]|nr:30S ribosomal protein S17e [archaeon]
MGKQMTSILKNKAQELYNRYPEKFTDKYEENKVKVRETGLFDYSKTDRNIVAGYITRLKTEEEKE